MRTLIAVVVVMLSGCGDPAAGLPEPTATAVGTAVGAPTSAMIGPAGGTVKTPDGRLSVKIPAGALSADTTISIQPITNTSHGARGLAYELLPDGQTFSTPAELTLAYADEDVAGSAPEFLTWAVQTEGGLWEVQHSTLDAAARTLTVATTHFSHWSPGVDLEIIPSIARVKVGTQRRFEVLMCSIRPLGRDSDGVSHSRFACTRTSTSFASRVLGPWMVDGIVGGNTTLGTVSGPELVDYKAPNKVPNPDTVFLSAKVTAYDGGIAAPLGVRVRLVEAGTTYGGRYEFSQQYANDMTVTGSADFVWTPMRDEGDVIHYTASTSLVNAHIVVNDCDPVDQVLPTTDSEFVLYTASNVAFPRQYHFNAATEATINLRCGTPRATISRATAVVLTGGLCQPPPFASFTDEARLAFSESCQTSTASWSFDALD